MSPPNPLTSRTGTRSARIGSQGDGFSAIITDIIVWLVATELAALSRYDFDASEVQWGAVTVLALFMAGAQLIVGAGLLLYGRRYQVGSFDELRAIAVSVTAVSAVATAVVLIVQPHSLPRSVAFVAWPLAFTGMLAVRIAKRLIKQSNSLPTSAAERILIFGAGWVGSELALRMLRDPTSPFRPVGFLDDDPAKSHLQRHGLRVCGTSADIAQAAQHFGATRLVIAVNRADASLIRRVSDAADEAGIGCLVMPPLNELLRGAQVQLSSLRAVDVEDVIGRRPVDTDVTSIAQYITGRRVLVTGAGGSIGSELCRQLHKFGPSELIMLDRDESALHAVELSIYGRALLESPEIVLVDIRDPKALHDVFIEHQPQVVFHAAALKHLTLLERYPQEALLTNVYGTLNVLHAAAAGGVEHFVNISTDKAANPASALGHSKRLAEQVTAWFAIQGHGGEYLSVRFGNVLGSRGSVLHAFAAQIENGGPVTVTDPEVTRFFMTIPEACQLVIQAGAIGRPGEALVLDMGDPIKIVDVARRMITMSGKDIEVVFTGLRPGEKMHEVLLGDGEASKHPSHPMISHVDVPPLNPDEVEQQAWTRTARRTGSSRLATAL